MCCGSGLKARSAGLKLKHFACSAGQHQELCKKGVRRGNPKKNKTKNTDAITSDGTILRDNLTGACLGGTQGAINQLPGDQINLRDVTFERVKPG